jgi:hypothetical protein
MSSDKSGIKPVSPRCESSVHCCWQCRRPPRSPSTNAFFQSLDLVNKFGVALEKEEQRLEREQNEGDDLEALGDYKCDARMSVENVSAAVVNSKILKGRFTMIAHKFSTGWAVGEVESVEKKKSVAVYFLLL